MRSSPSPLIDFAGELRDQTNRWRSTTVYKNVWVQLSAPLPIMEEKFGISGRLSNFERPRVFLKRTPEDFAVNEIGLDGIVLQSGAEYKDESLQRSTESDRVPSLEEILELGINPQDAERIFALYEGTTREPVVLELEFNKLQRTEIHSFFKLCFGQKLVTESPASGKVRICRRTAHGGNSLQQNNAPYDKRNIGSPDLVPFLQFVLEKRAMDTMEAISSMARAMGSRPVRDFSFAGTKDRHAVTTQKVVLRNAVCKRLLGVNSVFKSQERWLKISQLERAAGPLSLGDLAGNQFKIRLFFENASEVDWVALSSAANLVQTNGFINYYGMQRFGTHSISTDQVGEAMLQGNYQKACDLIISDRFPDIRELFVKNEYEQALQKAPSFLHTEKAILKHLFCNPKDFEGALMAIPRESRILYVHAWQSRIFNETASIRLSQCDGVLPGDLVLCDSAPVLLTEENISEHTIYDVVLPLPGYDVVYPQSIPNDLYKIGNDINFRPKNKAMYDISGTYRKLLIIPQNFTFSFAQQEHADLSFSLPPSSYATMALRELFECIE